MSSMKPSTVGRPPSSEPTHADAVGNDRPAKAYGDRHFKPVITPGLFKGPILPVWLSKFFRRDKA
jgi:hypothetical protein